RSSSAGAAARSPPSPPRSPRSASTGRGMPPTRKAAEVVMRGPLRRSVGMTMLLRVVMLIAVAAVVAACGGNDPSPAAALPGPTWYEAIDGAAFRDDTITIEPDGTASVETRAGTRFATLTAAELRTLARGVDDAGLTGMEDALTDPPVPDALS